MSKSKIQKTLIRERYLFGEKLTNTITGDYVEVIRVDSCGAWDTFCYSNGKQTRGTAIGNASKTECTKRAKQWLNR